MPYSTFLYLKPESLSILFFSLKQYVLAHFPTLSPEYKEMKLSHQKHKLGLKPLGPST